MHDGSAHVESPAAAGSRNRAGRRRGASAVAEPRGAAEPELAEPERTTSGAAASADCGAHPVQDRSAAHFPEAPAEPARHDTEAWVRSLRADAEPGNPPGRPASSTPDAPPVLRRAPGGAGVDPGARTRTQDAVVRRAPEVVAGSEDGADSAVRSTVVVPVPSVQPDAEAIRERERVRTRHRRWRTCAGVIEWAGSLFAILLVVHAVLTVGGADPGSLVVRGTGAAAGPLATGFRGLFQQGEPALGFVLDHGSAAVFWLIAGTMAGRLIRKLCE